MKLTLLSLLLLASVSVAEQPSWTLADDKTVNLHSAAGAMQLVDGGGSVVFAFPAAHEVRGAVLSEGHRCLLLLVDIERVAEGKPGFRPYDYGYLLRVRSDATGLKVSRVLERGIPPMNELHRWVSELGAVSDDGSTALLKFGAANRDKAPYTMDYVWQTWDLDTPKVLGTGLTLQHGKR